MSNSNKKPRFDKKSGKGGQQFWRRSHQDNKQQQRNSNSSNGNGNDDSDGEEEDGRQGEHRSEDQGNGSYSLEIMKESTEYAQRQELDGPKRKYAVGFGYLGSQYQGLQINRGCRSVEKELERALFLAGAIAECNFGDLHKLQWSRAARTDKGVHAIGQCCSMKLTIPTDGTGKSTLVQRANSFLPDDIRIFTFSKVTKNFNAKITCSQRRYHYLLPTYMLSNGAASRAVLGAAKIRQGDIRDCARVGGFSEPGSMLFLGPECLQTVRTEHFASHRATLEQLTNLRAALGSFVGTHAFHNYTTGKKFTDANARRFIKEFSCGEPFVVESTGVEWVLCSVVGQSFLLNQIRKMIGAATEVARGCMTLEQLGISLMEGHMEVPMAPGLGLYLDELFFDQYNFKQDNEREYVESLHAKAALARAGHKFATPETIRASAQAAIAAASGVSASAVASVSGSLDAVSNDNGEVGKRKRDGDGDGEGADAEDANEAAADDDVEDGDMERPQTNSSGGVPKECAIDLNSLGEPIRWSADPTLAATMQQFRNHVIWPHIYEEESTHLHFLYYLDYLRVRNLNYDLKTRGNGEGKTKIVVGQAIALARQATQPAPSATTEVIDTV